MAASPESRYWWPEEPGPETTVAELLERRAAIRGEHTALVAPSLLRAEQEARLGYADLLEGAKRMAAVLREAGVGPGDRVGIMLDNEGAIEAHLTYHASHRLGAINVPLNTRYVARELEYVLGFVKPKAVVFAPAFAELLGSMRPTLGEPALLEAAARTSGRSLGELLGAAEPLEEPAAAEADADADWIFTSGTTGKPKAVALTHRGSVACGYQAIGSWGLDPDSVYQAYAPFFTSTGCHSNPLACLAAGCTYVIEEEFDVHGTLDRMERHGTTSIFLIATVLALILERRTPAELEAYDFSSLRRVCHGAQPSSAGFYHRIWEEIRNRWEVELVNIYGLTEGGTSGIMLTDEDHPEALRRIGSYGLSIGRTGFREWVEFTVLNADDEEVGPDEVGEICMRGPSTMSRYANDPAATARALRGGWLHTGDMATRDEDGFLYFVDRNAQLIRRGGLNVSSAEVESVLLEHEAVAEVAVVPRPNPVLGSDVRVVVVAEPGAEPSAEELIEYAASQLADYKVPVEVDFVEALPRNGMNRVIKGALTGEGESLSA